MSSAHGRDSGRMTWWQILRSCGSPADRKNQYRFLAWMAAWGASFLGASWVLEHYEGLRGTAAWAIALLPSAFAVGALLAYLHFLRTTDDLLRRIQLEGLAFGFGAGVIFSTGYQVLERAGAAELGVSTTIVVMMFGWGAGQLVATSRYR